MKPIWMLLLLLASPTFAADPTSSNVCNVQPAGPSVPLVDYQPTAKAICTPGPLGVGTVPAIRANSAGVTAWMWCPAGTGWRLQFAAATWAWLAANSVATDGAAVSAKTSGGAQLTALNAALDRNASTPLADPSLTPVWCPQFAAMLTSRPLDTAPPIPTPTPGTWITSGLSTYTTSAGKLGAFAGLTSRGRVCDCSKPVKVGAVSYCTFTGAATGIVAQCSPTP